MNKTKIEWTDYTINPIKGLCKGNCWYCYARQMYKRFKWNENIRLDLSEFSWLKKVKKPSRIFVGSMHDIFGNWISDEFINYIIKALKFFPQHTFQFLTKNPKRYAAFNFPDNCWLGQTIMSNNSQMFLPRERGITYISFEPLLGSCDRQYIGFNDWIIIGSMTGSGSQKYQPKEEWIRGILKKADKHNIPVFMKNNLKKVWTGKLRQEFPDGLH